MSNHDDATTGQITTSAAEVYETFFVPALFAQWPERLLDAVGLRPGDRVLDVGCGTGVVARSADRRLAGSGTVTGIDVNPAMLGVAKRTAGHIDWREGRAERLPFDTASFDRVVAQFALMFFTDPMAAVGEMARVTRPGGMVGITTWCDVAESPGYSAMVTLLDEMFGAAPADALLAPFAIGTVDKLRAAVGEQLTELTVTRHLGHARFESLDAWLHTEIRGWTLTDMIDDDRFAELQARARVELNGFVSADGSVSFPAPALIATAVVS